MTALLDVRNLAKSFGGVGALRGVSFDVGRGELVAMIGPNGAGKTTCFNLVNGQLKADGGRVIFNNQDVLGLPPRKIWRLGVGRTFQVPETFVSMTVAENIQLALLSHHRRLYRLLRPARNQLRSEAQEIMQEVGIEQLAGTVCGLLAYGDVKLVELAIALANGPQLLLMDEPTAGMAAGERAQLMTLITRIVQERDIGVLFTEHDMGVVFQHATRIVVLDRGRLIAEGPPDQVRADEEVQAVYLGYPSKESRIGRSASDA